MTSNDHCFASDSCVHKEHCSVLESADRGMAYVHSDFLSFLLIGRVGRCGVWFARAKGPKVGGSTG